MVVQCSSSLARRAALGVAGVALALLGGCVVAPVEPYEVGAPVVYSGTPYYYGGYEAPAYYYGAPYYRPYWGPAVSLGFFGSWGSGNRWHGHRGGGDRHWRGNPGRGGNHWQGNPGRGGGNWGRGGGGGRRGFESWGNRRP